MVIGIAVLIIPVLLFLQTYYLTTKSLKAKQEVDEAVQSKYDFDKHFFISEGLRLYGELYVPSSATKLVITVPGWSSNHKKFVSLSDFLIDNNIACFNIDLRYQGYSEGKYIGASYEEPDDVINAINYLKTIDETKNLDIYVVGVSMGGATVLNTVDKRINGTLAFAPYSDFLRVIDKKNKLSKFRHFLIKLALKVKFKDKMIAPIDRALKIENKILIVHCKEDRVVPIAESIEFDNLLKERDNYKFIKLEGSAHAPWLIDEELNIDVAKIARDFIKEEEYCYEEN